MRLSLAAIVLAAAVLLRAGAQTIDIISPSDGLRDTRAYTVSDDGRVVHGVSYNSGGPDRAAGFFWTRDGQRADYHFAGTPPLWVFAYGGSGDGRFGVGDWAPDRNHQAIAFRYSVETGLESLGVLSRYASSRGVDASFDGGTVVGYCTAAGGLPQQAFVWTSERGMLALPFFHADHFYSEAMAVSADGSVIVGGSGGWNDKSAVLWTASGGMTELPALAGTGSHGSEAFGINDLGDIAVGYSGPVRQAVQWRHGQVEALPRLFELSRSSAKAVSSDGGVIVGQTDGSNFAFATVWTSAGAQYLGDYFRQFGVLTPDGFNYLDCTSVSADGLTFCGSGYTTNSGVLRGFVVTIPAPSTMLIGLAASSLLARRRF